MQKRSILFLTNAYPDFPSSYHGIFIQKMAVLIKNEGYKIFVVTPKIYKKSSYYEKKDGIKVYRFPFLASDKLLIEYKNIPYVKMVLYYLMGFLWVFYVVLRNRCHIIHAHWAVPTGLIGVMAGKLLKKPVIVTIHGSDLRMALERRGVVRKVFVSVCKNAAQLNCVSEVQKKGLEQLGIPNEKIFTIPMGIDEPFLKKGEQRKREPEERPVTILSNRNLLPIYNVSLFIRAIPIVLQGEPNTKFLIAGDGPERGNLERELSELKVSGSVKFLGRVPHEKMVDLLGKIDIFISTSLHDGTSVSLLEAMGSGAFPIVTDIPSNREWIASGQNGFLVPVNEAKVLAEKIIDAIRDKTLLERSRKENLSIIEKKGLWSVNIEKIKKMYSEL